MIISFSVSNFRSIKETQTLSFQAAKSTHLEDYYITKIGKYRLSKIAYIYGANASGKSNILRAMAFLRELVVLPLSNKTEKLDYETFQFDPAYHNQDTEMEIDFIENGTRYDYEVIFNHSYIVKEVLYQYAPGKRKVFERTTDVQKKLPIIVFGDSVKKHKQEVSTLTANTLWNTTVISGFNRISMDVPQLQDVSVWFDKTLPPIWPNTKLSNTISLHLDKGTLNKDTLLHFFNQADFGIHDILLQKKEEVVSGSIIMALLNNDSVSEQVKQQISETGAITHLDLNFEHWVNGVAYPLPFKEESQGTQRYYGLSGVLQLLIDENRILIMDELETSIHPDLFQHFLLTYLINAKQSQLIITTHNRELLNDQDLFRKDSVWITDRHNPEQMTELYNLQAFNSSVIRDTTNVLNAYKAGKLGGIPELGSTHYNPKDHEKESE